MISLGIAGYSGAGKTTLIERLIPCLAARGVVTSVLKHSHHDFDVDRPGKDSWRHRQAGAQEVLVVGGKRWVLMHELRESTEASVDDLAARLSPCDLLLVEGYKATPLPKLEVFRAVSGVEPLHARNPTVIAVARDVPLECALPQLDVNDPARVADWIVGWMRAAQ